MHPPCHFTINDSDEFEGAARAILSVNSFFNALRARSTSLASILLPSLREYFMIWWYLLPFLFMIARSDLFLQRNPPLIHSCKAYPASYSFLQNISRLSFVLAPFSFRNRLNFFIFMVYPAHHFIHPRRICLNDLVHRAFRDLILPKNPHDDWIIFSFWSDQSAHNLRNTRTRTSSRKLQLARWTSTFLMALAGSHPLYLTNLPKSPQPPRTPHVPVGMSEYQRCFVLPLRQTRILGDVMLTIEVDVHSYWWLITVTSWTRPWYVWSSYLCGRY